MYSVLVVDDNKTNLQLLKQLLSKQYNVIPVLSGKLALYYVEKRRPDIILLDLLMPEMDGMAVFEALKRMPSAKDIPIIFLTADNEKETENSCLKAGAADFIAKPFVPEVMITRIEKALELAQLRSKLQTKMEEQREEGEEGAGITIAAHDIMELLDEKGYRHGAYRVTYSDFQKIYHFLARWVERTKQKIQLLLLTVQRVEEGLEELSKLEQSVRVLEQGISKSLRSTDMSTRYSSCQYIVTLINTDKDGATTVMERIQSYYKEHVEDMTYEVTYDIVQVQA